VAAHGLWWLYLIWWQVWYTMCSERGSGPFGAEHPELQLPFSQQAVQLAELGAWHTCIRNAPGSWCKELYASWWETSAPGEGGKLHSCPALLQQLWLAAV
jgi:hypothetical protein